MCVMSSPLFLPNLDVVHPFLWILMLVAVVAGSSVIYVSSGKPLYGFMLPVLMTLVFWLFSQDQDIATLLGWIDVAYIALLIVFRRRYQQVMLQAQQREKYLQKQVEKGQIHEKKIILHQDILQDIAVHHGDLKRVLVSVVGRVESLYPDMMASILLLDDAGKHLVEGAAPSLPEAWNKAVDGIAIGEGVGSCGTAAFRKERVVVSDIENDPLWSNYRDAAMGLGLRACWSQPIIGVKGSVLGTFALYYSQPRHPLDEELDWIEYMSHLIAIAIENAKQHTALQRLLRDKQELSEVIEQSTDYIFKLNLKGKVIVCNQVCREFFTGDLEGKNLFDFLPREQVALIQLMMQKKLHDGGTTRYEIRIPDQTGLLHDFEINSSLRMDEGKAVGINAIARDMTERKDFERVMELRMQAMNASHEPIMILNDLGLIEFANPAAGRLYDVPYTSMIGKSAASLRKGMVGDDLYRHIIDTIHQGETWVGEIVFYSSEQGERTVERRVSPIMDTEGHVHHQICIDRDITEFKKQQQKMEHTQRLESLGVLAGGIAHDFNNILAAVMLNAGIAEKSHQPERIQVCLQRIRQGSERAADLCQQMLAYSGQGKMAVGALSMSDVVCGMMQLMEVSIHKQVELVYDLPSSLPNIVADKAQIQQVILNLMTNANEAIDEQQGQITCSTGTCWMDETQLSNAWTDDGLPAGNYVYLAVSDTGCGMDKVTLSKIFDPFYTTKFTGRGLGMSAMLGIIRGHHGSIQIDTSLGKGTTIQVYFPVSKENSADNIDAKSMKKHTEQASCPAKENFNMKGKVLVVDDEEAIREVACAVLEDMGFDSIQASNGEEALQCYSANMDEIVCVLLDMTMPKMDGKACLKELHRLDPNVKVLLSSGYHEEELYRIFDADKLEGFIHKPYLPASLEEKIVSILSP